MENLIRVGRISSVDYQCGMVEVLYPDRDDSVTAAFPYLSFNDEYKMPQIGQSVLVLHLSSGTSAGVVLGPYHNKSNLPKYFGKDTYYKEIAEGTYLLFKNETLTVAAQNLTLQDANGSITLNEILRMKEDIAALKAGGGA